MIEYENLSKVNSRFEEEFKSCFNKFLSGPYILGNEVKKFETNYAKYIGVNHCVGVASGLDALVLSLKVFKFKKNKEVIVPSNTYIASILAIIHAGLKPILVEPNIETYNIENIEPYITKNTVAIMPVHLYGKSCNMKIITDIAENHKLKIIEDCAQAHGATYNNKKVGSFGLGCFSFYPTKNLGCLGDGGAICVDDDEIYNQLIKLRNYGRTNRYENDCLGYNSRLDEIQAGFLNIKLKYLDSVNQHKRLLAKAYNQYLDNKFIKPIEDNGHVYHIYNIRHSKRDKLKKHLFDYGIQTEIHYPISSSKQKVFKKYRWDHPISEKIHNTTLSLPCSLIHNENQIVYIAEILNNYL